MPEQVPAYTIRTQDGNSTVSTVCESGWDIAHWVEVHTSDILESDQPHHDTLNTAWNTANGRVSEETGRNPGESDYDFKVRHMTEVADRMASDPPITMP